MNNCIIKNSRNTNSAPKNHLSTQTVAFSHYNNISAQLPLDPKTGNIVIGGIKEQAKQCLSNIKSIVESIGHVMDDMVKINIFVKKIEDIKIIDEIYTSFFDNSLPTRTVVAVAALPISDALVQMDALLSNGEGTTPQKPCALLKVSRNTVDAPLMNESPQTVAFSHYNNLSAQLPIDPLTGKLIDGGIEEQTKQCLNNIKAILKSIGHVTADIVKTTIYIKNIRDVDTVNDICNQFFYDYIPARTIVKATDLPMEALVQIDAVVSHGDGTPPQLPEDSRFIVIEASNTEKAPKSSYSHTVAFSHYNHLSGQLPIIPETGKIISDNITEQTEQCFNNIKSIIESVEHVMDDIVKVNIQLKNIDDLDIVNEIYVQYFKNALPARTIIGVSSIPMRALIQVDAVVSNCEGTPPQNKCYKLT
ncbi:RidA family protein [Photobacterium leiognathi]|uniref:RidA family protein n=1 Tax=Photobacterium leiognathi TaxID=553611 RepID=UPI002981276F|nr:RidA family protein [Photobacterium leiognathi]